MGDYPILSRWGPNAVTSVLREAEGDTILIHRGGGDVNTEAEIGVTRPQAKECQ